jgi:cobalt-zinc-cadmium efflux system protein
MNSVTVIVSGVIIKYTSIYWVAPVLTVLINVIILKSSYSVLKESINILMQSSIRNISLLSKLMFVSTKTINRHTKHELL